MGGGTRWRWGLGTRWRWGVALTSGEKDGEQAGEHRRRRERERDPRLPAFEDARATYEAGQLGETEHAHHAQHLAKRDAAPAAALVEHRLDGAVAEAALIDCDGYDVED